MAAPGALERVTLLSTGSTAVSVRCTSAIGVRVLICESTTTSPTSQPSTADVLAAPLAVVSRAWHVGPHVVAV